MNLEEDSIRAIQQRLKTIDIRHFCNHQIYHSLRDVKSTLASLEVSIQVQMAYNDSILETADLHTERDTAGLKNKLISATNRKVVSKWIYNANLDPWINEFYKYNVKPGLHWAGAVPVLQEYVKYKMALLQLEEALEGKKRKSKS